ncbi:MAG: DUF2911 domain-containing protein [Bacteroidota bacterium]
MKKILLLATAVALCTFTASAQLTIPDGLNKKASVSEQIGITDVTIHYSRPGMKGREGKIWGGLIHEGFKDLRFGTSRAAPWRAGANENTTIEISDDVKIEGKPLAAGKYALFVAYSPNESTVIFSKNSTSWGSFFYDEKEDVLRVKVKPQPLEKSVEWLKYEFINQTPNAATVALQWEELMIPFTIETDYIANQLASIRRELRTRNAFDPDAWADAARFAAVNSTDLPEALHWAEQATSGMFGEKTFTTLSSKAIILNKMNRTAEADAVMKEAMPMATMQELHNYGRQLLNQKRTKEALEVFKMNYDKNPNEFTTMMGMARGYSGTGDFKKALEFAQKAQPKAPDTLNKDNVARLIKLLQEGKDINS